MMDSYRFSRDLMGAYPASLKIHSFLSKTRCSKNLDLRNGRSVDVLGAERDFHELARPMRLQLWKAGTL